MSHFFRCRVCILRAVLAFLVGSFALLVPPPVAAAPDTNVAVTWNQLGPKTTPLSFGMNLYNGSDLYYNHDSRYASNLNTLKSGILRIHNGSMMGDSQDRQPGGNSLNTTVDNRGWVKNPGQSNYSWDSPKILQCLANIQAANYSHELLMNFPNWPSYMDDGTGHLRSDQFAAYAAFCAALVRVVEGGGYYVKYWEPTNEVDGAYYYDQSSLLSIWTACRNAIKSVDGSVQVGGLAVANAYAPILQPFYNLGTADFVSVHSYGYGGGSPANFSDADIYNRADGVSSAAAFSLGMVANSPRPNTPVFLDEYNIRGDAGQPSDEPRMHTNVGAVFDALVVTGAIKQGVTATLAWNEQDGSYGKFDASYNLRPGAALFSLLNSSFLGQTVAATSTNTEVSAFAVKSGARGAVMLLNRSDNTHVALLNLSAWNNPWHGTVFPLSQISAAGPTSGGVYYGTLTEDGNFTLPPNSVTAVVFDGSTFAPDTGAFSGARTVLSGAGSARIEAENFDLGGEGVAYHDRDVINRGGLYRPAEGVDIEACTDTGGGYDVGWTDTGEYMNYSVQVADGGSYDFGFRVASQWGGQTFHLEDETGRNLTGTVTVPQTWGGQNWTTTTIRGIALTTGAHVFRLVTETGGYNINSMTATLGASVADGNYVLTNRNSGKVLDILSQSTADGAAAVQRTAGGGSSQTWHLSYGNNGYYTVTNQNSGKVLSVSGGGSTADGATVIQWSNYGHYDQQWALKPLGGGFYCLVNRNSGKLLDVNGGSWADDASVIQWSSNGGYNQQWSLALR